MSQTDQIVPNVNLEPDTQIPAKVESMPPPPRAKQLPMVGWYAPLQLAKTGIEVAISTIFGQHSDHRLVEAMASGDNGQKFFDYTCHYTDDGKEVFEENHAEPRDSIWIDYVGDVGDGWNSTYAIACQIAASGSSYTYTDQQTGKTFTSPKTERGAVLIFGGDEVYPTASREVYNARLVAPYETALRYSEGNPPHVFAIPGNHDWYDSLVAFTRLFTARPWFAGWRTRQKRSYFALKLPHNWWLLGTDVQLGSDIDAPQMDYFESLAQDMEDEKRKTNEDARIILCHAEPHWIRAAEFGGDDPNFNESNLKLLEKRLGKKVAVFIAGDLHHYRRHESEDGSTQKITAGGGGAFLHPTHPGLLGTKMDELVEKGLKGNIEQTFKLRGCFPSTRDSQHLTWRNLIFPYLKGNASRTFGVATAVLYLLMTLAIIWHLDEMKARPFQFWMIVATGFYDIVNSPVTMFLIAATFIGFFFFTDTNSWLSRLIMGAPHALAHISAAFIIAVFSVFYLAHIPGLEFLRFNGRWHDYPFPLDFRMGLAALMILIGGYLAGSFIMGLYLLISLNFFGRHANEAFSSLGIEDWKNFLRLNIDETGKLTIYPIGLRKVSRQWKAKQEGAAGPEMVPADSRATAPELIEMPVVMERARTQTGVKTNYSEPVSATSPT